MNFGNPIYTIDKRNYYYSICSKKLKSLELYYKNNIIINNCYMITSDKDLFYILQSDIQPDEKIKFLIIGYDFIDSIDTSLHIDSDLFTKKFTNIEGVIFCSIHTKPYNSYNCQAICECKYLIKNEYLGLIQTLPNLKYLHIGKNCNFSNDTFYRLPNTLTHLEMYISDDYDFTDMLDMFPSSLEVFITSNTFESELSNLPPSLKKLCIIKNNDSIGDDYSKKPLNLSYLPIGLEELIIWGFWNIPFYLHNNIFDNLPPNLKTLCIYEYNFSLENLPINLEQLVILKWNYKGSVINLPCNLKTLICYSMIDISSIVFPKQLEILFLDKYNDAILLENKLPDSISVLKVNHFNQLLDMNFQFPKNLKTIYVMHDGSLKLNIIDTSKLQPSIIEYINLFSTEDNLNSIYKYTAPNYKIISGHVTILFKCYFRPKFSNIISNNYRIIM